MYFDNYTTETSVSKPSAVDKPFRCDVIYNGTVIGHVEFDLIIYIDQTASSAGYISDSHHHTIDITGITDMNHVKHTVKQPELLCDMV